MRTRAELAVHVLQTAHDTLSANVAHLTLDEALHAAGGHRSVLGILKHIAGWSHVYHSYAFDPSPKHWKDAQWPRGLRDTVETTQDYVDEIIAWFEESAEKWRSSLSASSDEDFDTPRPLHWGQTAPLFDVVVLVANHWTYHTGEFNEVLSIVRGEAWEYTEEVEENHISTAGHRVRPGWMSDVYVKAYEAYITARDRELHGPAR